MLIFLILKDIFNYHMYQRQHDIIDENNTKYSRGHFYIKKLTNLYFKNF